MSTTVLANVSTAADIKREEMFGPVATLIRCDTGHKGGFVCSLELTALLDAVVDW